MPNRVAWTFLAVDKFSGVAERLARRTAKVRKKIRELPAASVAAATVVKASFRGMAAAAGTLTAGMAPLLAGFAGLAAVGKFVTVGTRFEDALADLSAITNSTGERLAFLADESIRLGKEVGVSAAETAVAFKSVASAKSELLDDPKALSNVTRDVLLLQAAAGIDLDQATRAVTLSLNQFGAEADQARRFVNALAAGSVVGSSEIFETSEAIKNAGVEMAAANISFEEGNALIQVIARGGIKGAEAGTKLKTALANMAVKMGDVAPAAVGVVNSLELLAKKNLDAKQLSELFGLESKSVAQILINNVPLIKKWTEEIKDTNTAEQQAAIRLKTLSSRFRVLAATVAEKVISAFDKLRPRFEAIVDDMGRFFESITPEDVDRFAATFGNVVDLLREVGKLAGPALKVLRLLFKGAEFATFVPRNLLAAAEQGGSLGQLFGSRDPLLALSSGGALDVTGTARTETEARAEVEMVVKAPRDVVTETKESVSGTGMNLGFNLKEDL